MRVILFFSIIFIFHSIFAQKTPEVLKFTDEKLMIVINKLEEVYGVKFSYNSESIENTVVSLNLKHPTLAQTLVDLQRQLHFNFKKIDERYYVIKHLNKVYVCGYLKDVVLQKPIVGARISNIQKDIKTITSANGYFLLSDVSINDTLSIESLGYKVKRIP
uniref:FecR domain-containing protein n=1 Tax=Aquimarina agarilytica TaxID=1087449 RepID=UPI0002886FC6